MITVFKIIALILIVNVGLAQVFIPFGFLKPVVTLTISDGATFNFGTVAVNTPTDKTFTISNSSFATAGAMSGTAFGNAAYTFKGGSYPGTGGTCSTTLSAGASCTVVVTANSAAVATVNDTLTINYQLASGGSTTATRAVTASFTNTAAQLMWISPPNFVRVNDCQALTLQRQDSAGNGIITGSATAITGLLFNNGVTATYYSDSGCTASITTSSIGAGANSVTIYFKNTTSGQTGILIATAASLTSASKNITITTAPTKLFINPAPTIKLSTCTIVPIMSVDANSYPSNVTANVTVNLTTSGANTYYSDSGCSASIASAIILSGTNTINVYTTNSTIQTATLTATDAAAALSTSNKSVNFNTSLTWWNASWTRRIRIDINNSDQATSFTNQPVLIKITSSIINYADIQASGADIRFVASDDVTQINHEFDYWNSSGTSEIWVRIPTIAASSSAGYFYMYYNNPSAIDGQNRNGVWTNYWSVWHLGQDPTGSAPQFTDATGNGRDGTSKNSPTRTTGYIGLAANLSSATDAVDINQDLSAALGVSSTLSAWMRTSQTGNNTVWNAPGITGVEQSGGGNDIFFGWIDGGGLIGVTAGNGANAKSSFLVNNNAWRHVTITRNSASGAVVFYINGVASGSATSETGNKTTYFDLLGEIGDTGGSPVNYNGILDEVRIYNSVQTAAQVLADFKFLANTNLIYNSVESGP